MQRLLIEQACTRLMNEFAVFNDQGRFADLAELFIDDAVYARPIMPDTLIQGHANIRAAFESRPKERVGRHLITNILIDVQAPDRAIGSCYALLFSGAIDKPAEKFGLQAVPPQLVGEYHDEFVLTPHGWKFSQRKGRIIFSA
ncbi:MAG TPA: nuclear transport factor 2 family protein [Candidatus Acidoferrum sp.]|nr:nuclear transport factor 2 family protein [Candidatus Acidoferrum sp.]